MKAKLLKPMLVDGQTLQPGKILDVSGWRNAKALESMRYIVFVVDNTPEVDNSKAVKAQPQEPVISLS